MKVSGACNAYMVQHFVNAKRLDSLDIFSSASTAITAATGDTNEHNDEGRAQRK
jgi:hypothetical protein